MQTKDIPSDIKDQEQPKLLDSYNMLNNIKSDYFIQKLFDYIHQKKTLKTIKYNKNIQKRMNININNF